MTEKQGKPIRLELTYIDPDTGMVSRQVVQEPSEKFSMLAPQLFAPDSHYQIRRVADDTPLGEHGRGKVFHYRRNSSQYADETINYEIDKGVARFVHFKPLIAENFSVGVRHGEDGDLLEVDLGKSKFAPTDNKEVNRIHRVMRAIQKFNNELLNDAMDEDEEQEDPAEFSPKDTQQHKPSVLGKDQNNEEKE